MIINLLNNAYKYTQQGLIIIRVGSVSSSDGKMLHVAIEDTGIGIRREELGRLFKLNFNSASAGSPHMERGGIGMGLTISRNIVTQYDGEINVESVLNEGSTFSFTMSYKDM